jgi:predicted kinase
MSGCHLIVLSGLPGTGKSTLADGIGRELRLPVVSVDQLESAILRAGITQSFETGLAAYLVAEAVVDHQLGLGVDVVVDAVNAVEPARDTWRELARRHRAAMSVFVCVLDRTAAAARLRERNRGLALPEPTEDDVDARASDWTPWFEPHLVLDAANDQHANLAQALESLRNRP